VELWRGHSKLAEIPANDLASCLLRQRQLGLGTPVQA
jgi:hypothetical protein